MNEEIPKPDPGMTKVEKAFVDKLSQEDVEIIDKTLLSNATNEWRKVAMIVAITMMNLPNRVQGIPDIFYAQRVRKLVEGGRLESQGNLKNMRFSEVRLPN